MFRRSQPVTFSSYGRRPSRWRLPRWLWLLLGGTVAGAGGVLYVQESYLPPRLTAEASAALQTAFDAAEAERLRLARDVSQATRQLAAAAADKQALTLDLAAGRSLAERLQGDLASVVAALPPDPRSGTVEVRAARFAASGGMLVYDVVLTREQAAGKPLAGLMQLVVSGDPARPGTNAVTLKPITLLLGRHEVLRGSVALPDGFRPRQTTVRILDRSAGQLLGMRVGLVR